MTKSISAVPNIIPFLIIIFSILIIYYIIHSIQYENFLNNIENFEDTYISDYQNEQNKTLQILKTDSTVDTDKIKIDDVNLESNMGYITEFSNGSWTSLSSTIDNKGVVNNLMNIQIAQTKMDSSYGTITLPPNDLLKTSETSTFEIIDVMNTIIQGKDINNKFNYISIYFLNRFSNDENNPYELPYYVGTEPRCIISYFQYGNLVKRYISYKLKDSIAGSQLARVIYSKEMQLYEPKLIFNLTIYSVITGDYQFPPNYITFQYNKKMNLDKNVVDKIKEKYNNKFTFAIQRQFYSPTGNTIATRVSPFIVLNIDNNNIPSDIKVVSMMQDLISNHLDALYQPKATVIYFNQFIKSDNTYSYSNTNESVVSSTSLNLKNNSDSMFKQYIQYPDVKSITKNIKNNYNLIPLKTVFIQNLNQEIVFPFSDIYNLL